VSLENQIKRALVKPRRALQALIRYSVCKTKEIIMKIFKRLLLAFGIVLILFLSAAILIPVLFKDRIMAEVKEQLNNNLTASVDFESVTLSLIRNFPHISLGITNYTVVGTGVFKDITLAKGEAVEVGIDLSSFWNKENPYIINAVHLTRPALKIYVLEDGTANYDIIKAIEEPVLVDSTGKIIPTPEVTMPFEIDLKAYSIVGADVVYQDATYDLHTEIKGMDHRGRGNFTEAVYDLITATEIQSLSLWYGSIPYLKDANTTLNATFTVEALNNKYTLKDNQLRVNELDLEADGYVIMHDNEDYEIDFRIHAPDNNFKDLLSLIPNAYIAGYKDVKASGLFKFNASAKGIYNASREVYPAVDIALQVTDASAKYPDLPMALEGIQADMQLKSPGGILDSITVTIPTIALTVNKRPFQLSFGLKTPMSDPDIDATMVGIINLEEWSKAFPMDGLRKGIIDADIQMKTRMSYIDRSQYDKVNVGGKLAVQQLVYGASDMPVVVLNSVSTRFTPQRIEVDEFKAQLGESDIDAKGHINNVLAYFSPRKTMTGSMSVRSGFLNLNEWMSPAEEPSPSLVNVSPTASAAQSGNQVNKTVAAEAASPIFDRFDFRLSGNFKTVKFSSYTLKNVFADGNIKPNQLDIKDSGLQIGSSDVRASGSVINLFDYVFNHGTLAGDLVINSGVLNLNQFMGTESFDSPKAVPGNADIIGGSYAPVPVPENIILSIKARVGRLIYTDYDLTNLDGQISVKDQVLSIEDATAGFLGGKIGLTGNYDANDLDNPGFNMKYSMRDMSFQRVFKALNTYKLLTPLAGYLEGNFNTTLVMDGKLGKDLMPQLKTLNMRGFLETLNGVISNFKPFRELGAMLNIDYLSDNIKITNTKNWFEIKNGTLELQEFDYKLKDIDMKISGQHVLTESMHYKIKARIPRKLLEKTGTGATASKGFAMLSKEASKFGVNIRQREFVNVLIQITGTPANPKVALNLLGTDGESTITEQAEGVKEKVIKQAEEKLEEGKQVVKEKAEKALDSVKTVAGQKLQEVEQQAKETAKEKIGAIAAEKVDSATLKKAQELIDKNKEAERIKQELEKFNPFKKKKEKEKENTGG
jgi:hypothetical protein